MVYRILKLLVTFALKVYFRKVYFWGKENINPKVPTLLACNHPSGFLEPILLACLLPQPLHFLVRGDLFYKRWLRGLLLSTNQIPIFRFRDGFKELRNNKRSLEEICKKLNEGKHILVFAEGSSEPDRKLRPLQKGLAKIAFETMEAFGTEEIQVLPIGVNYENPRKFRSDVLVKIGEPIKLTQDYIKVDNPNKAYQNLTSEVFKRMREMIVHVDDKKNEELLAKVLHNNKKRFDAHYLPRWEKSADRLHSEIAIAEKINRGEELGDFILPNKKPNVLTFLLGIVPFTVSIVFNIIPLALAYFFSKRVVKKTVFIGSIRLASGLVFFLLFATILTLLLAASYPFRIVFLVISAWFVCTYMGLHFYDQFIYPKLKL